MPAPQVQQHLFPADHDHRQLQFIYRREQPPACVLAAKHAIGHFWRHSIEYRRRRGPPHRPSTKEERKEYEWLQMELARLHLMAKGIVANINYSRRGIAVHQDWAKTSVTKAANFIYENSGITMHKAGLKDAQKGLRTILEEMDVIVEGLEYFLHDPSAAVYQGSKKIRGSINVLADYAVCPSSYKGSYH
ncbi:hypothetical protein FIBSPDRAFT_601142 [Athelia psychrophila]|uniref:Uncharacterized protein n=1 Tax=Athelia psychrophila TaxID=1759441 RepID=A0A166GTD9_9AGAM|nr:hypothetical protein FIBSPDRAFT_601142 [Fibularhizoctonia sp. CBS 109695]